MTVIAYVVRDGEVTAAMVFAFPMADPMICVLGSVGIGVAELAYCPSSVTIWFRCPAALAAQMVPKGSVAVDGISLTLVDVAATAFSVALIPHTLAVTTLGFGQFRWGARRQGDAHGRRR